MLNKFLLTSVFTASLFGLMSASVAQDCDVNYEMVTKLFHPDPGSYAVWQTNYGEASKREEFTSLTLPADGSPGAMALGEVRDREISTPSLILVRVDHRGQTMWDKTVPVDRLSRVVKILTYKDGYLVLANAANAVWLGFFNADGILRENKTISGTGWDLSATDIIPAVEENGWIVAITKSKKAGTGENQQIEKESAVYKIDTKGSVIWNRSFTMGGNNEIFGLSKATFDEDKSGYIATGYLENGIGRKMGMGMRLDSDGALVWQQEYGRGLNAQLKVSSGYHNRYVLAFGDVRPVDAGSIGSWLLLLDGADGSTLWQRYYSSESGVHDYLARGLYVNKDSLITVMMQASAIANAKQQKPPEESDKTKIDSKEDMVGDIVIPDLTNYAHVLTLSPRGVTLAGDSYFEGKGVNITQLIEGPRGERMIAGSSMAPRSAAEIPRDFKPDWDKDFAYGPVMEKILEGPLKVNLPEAQMSENAKSGLALLNKKIKEKNAQKTDSGNQVKSDKDAKNVQAISVSKQKITPEFSENGWIVVGESPDPYNDPCKMPIIDLPRE